MTPEQRAVEEFHRATGAEIGNTPGIRGAVLRGNLIQEELNELMEAVAEGNLLAGIDAICDLLYVVHGTAVTWGLDIEPFFMEVHRSNMTKAGGPVRADGKILKPPTYSPPDLLPILREQTLRMEPGRKL